MWKLIFLPLLLMLLQCSNEFNNELEIPDPSFLRVLIELDIDQNEDGSISRREAECIESLSIWPSDIRGLTGLEAFINLDTLRVYMNPLEIVDLSSHKKLKHLEIIGCELGSLDVSGNHMLEYLDCSSSLSMKNYLVELDLSMNPLLKYFICRENQLNSLDVSANLDLIELQCGYNLLTHLNVSSNKNLELLSCTNNHLKDLDVTHNTELSRLSTCGNELTSLDIRNNRKLILLGIDNMPELHEVFVWELPFPPEGIRVLSDFSPGVEYILK